MPQLLGALAYVRLRRYHDFIAHLVGFLIPPILFFYLAMVIFISSAAREAQSHGVEVCGTFVGMMSLFILFLTGAAVVFSLIVQLALHARHRAVATSR